MKLNQLPNNIVVITGSNGTEQTMHTIHTVFKKSGFLVGQYQMAQNGMMRMKEIMKLFIQKYRKDVLFIQCDVVDFPKAYDLFHPHYLVVTSLSQKKKQMVDALARDYQTLNETIPYDLHLFLNADDSFSFLLGEKRKRVTYFGIHHEDANVTPQYVMTDMNLKTGDFMINEKYHIVSPNSSIETAYSFVSAFAIARQFGIDESKIVRYLTIDE